MQLQKNKTVVIDDRKSLYTRINNILHTRQMDIISKIYPIIRPFSTIHDMSLQFDLYAMDDSTINNLAKLCKVKQTRKPEQLNRKVKQTRKPEQLNRKVPIPTRWKKEKKHLMSFII